MEPRTNGHHGPLNLSALLRRSARIEVEYAGETFGVEYLPHAITTDVYLELEAATASETTAVEVLGVLLAKLVASWEIEMDGQPLPVSADSMRLFPIAMLAEVSTAIMRHVADPNLAAPAANSTPSSSGASAVAGSATAPTGTAW
jgi:hypothetical protein